METIINLNSTQSQKNFYHSERVVMCKLLVQLENNFALFSLQNFSGQSHFIFALNYLLQTLALGLYLEGRVSNGKEKY